MLFLRVVIQDTDAHATDQQIAVVIGTLENTNVTDNALRVERPKDQGGTHHVQ